MADSTSAAVSKQTEFVVSQPADAVSKQTEFVVSQPADAVSKQTEFVVQTPIQAVSKQTEFVVQTPIQAVSKQTEFVVAMDYAPPPMQTLALSSASYAAGTLSLGGSFTNGTLTALDVSTDGGMTGGAASSLSVTGTNYSATYDTTLGYGIYDLLVANDDNGVVSNDYTLTINPPPSENITLLDATGTIGQTLSMTGTVNYYPGTIALALNYSIDGGATFIAGENIFFSETGSFLTHGLILEAGFYNVGVQDANAPSVISNFIDLNLTPPSGNVSLLNIQTAM